jgi:hypothetical protein
MIAPQGTYSILGTLSLLTPWDIVGFGKLRIGGEGDGGYVLLDRLRPEQPALSYGVGPDSSFDLDLARRGHPVFMFDHTVNGPRGGTPKGCTFTREGVAPKADPEKKLDTIAAHLHRHGLVGRRDLLLKMDIEGSEWAVMAALPDQFLDSFEQIVIEFHWLQALERDSFTEQARKALQRLNARFTLCHVHANVFGGVKLVAGVSLPNVVEATYVRTELVTRTPNRTLYPTEHDRSNKPGTKDIVLSMYPFLPLAVPPRALAPLARRLDDEHAAAIAAQAPQPPAQG